MSLTTALKQLFFDGFGFEPPPLAVPRKKTAQPPKTPAAPVDGAKSAIENIANDGASLVGSDHPVSVSDALPVIAFRHPRANREALLGDVHVAYEFKRMRRKTIGFSVGVDGLVVSAPRWVPSFEVEQALHSKAAWVVRKLRDAQTRHAEQRQAQIDWRDGGTLPFLGQPVRLQLGGQRRSTQLEVIETEGHTERILHLALPADATPAQVRDAAQAWLMRQARRLFTERLDHYAPQLGVRWTHLSLSSAHTRWGSASANGRIRLNWRLMHWRLPIIDYVVVHELAHLREMNHSPRFWDTVATVMPDYAERRHALKTEAAPPAQ